jgi:2-methylisocitrate lyase-like PEP mutase family enzyme|tara:strand:+ start:3178 stop:4005 length:828 start_codon:yes stop_codon:yes gene_type:complete
VDAIDSDCLIILPGVYDGLGASIARHVGCQAIYASGGAIARSFGLPDLGLVSMTEMAARLDTIVRAFDGPVIADGDTGYGDVQHVRRMIQTFESAGIRGVHIEDQDFPKRCGHLDGKRLISSSDMARKIAAAVNARESLDFLIIGRTDAIAVEGFDLAVERAQSMIDAGADVIFIEAPETLDQLKTIPQLFDVPVMINMFPGGKTPYTPPADLQSWGYRYMIVPSDIQRACIQATEQILQAIKADGSSLKVADLLCPLADRDRIVDQDRWLEKPE